MTRPASLAVGSLALTAATLIAGCGTAAHAPAAQVRGGGAPFLATSLTTPAATWAVVVMGGSAASHNNFWQLFVRPAGSGRWRLVTPPGVPDNGGLVIAGGSQSVVAAFRPSQYLTFTPLTRTSDSGRNWSSIGPLDTALANTPDALAAAAGNGRMVALLTDGTVKVAPPSAAAWHTVVTRDLLAKTPPGRRCGLAGLTAASLSPAGTPIVAGSCDRPGVVGIFAAGNGGWQAAGPPVPAVLARQRITVLRLTRTGNTTTALLAAGTGPAASVLSAWSAGGGGHWALSPPLSLHGAAVTSASFGPGGAALLVMTGRRGIVITTRQTWKALPGLPPGTATLAPGRAGTFQAMAVHRGTLTIWQTSARGSAWLKTQTISVPIQYGSSG